MRSRYLIQEVLGISHIYVLIIQFNYLILESIAKSTRTNDIKMCLYLPQLPHNGLTAIHRCLFCIIE